jgi:hypothetical protein
MPSQEWFKDNPKVSAYISQDLNQRLEAWMRERNIRKVSQALTTILEEHLGVVQPSSIVQPALNFDRLDALEGKLKASLKN